MIPLLNEGRNFNKNEASKKKKKRSKSNIIYNPFLLIFSPPPLVRLKLRLRSALGIELILSTDDDDEERINGAISLHSPSNLATKLSKPPT
jgi:hypothetical protein